MVSVAQETDQVSVVKILIPQVSPDVITGVQMCVNIRYKALRHRKKVLALICV